MKNGDKEGTSPSERRTRAEERYNKIYTAKGIPPPEDNLKLIYELQVHQIELEMQNEELMQARNEIEASLEKYADLYDFAPTGYFTLTDEGVIREVNLKGASILGKDRLDLIKYRFIQYLSKRSKPRFISFLQKVFKGTSTETCEVELNFEEDHQIYLHIEATATATEKIKMGRQCRMSVLDITERKQAEEELKRSNKRFQVLTQNLNSGVALIDEHGQFSIVNPSFLKMFDLPTWSSIMNVNNRDWADWKVFDEEGTLLEVDEHPVRKAVITGKAVRNKLVGVCSPSGSSTSWMLISAEPVFKQDGRIDATICTYYDITERKRAEAELSQYRDNLEDLVSKRTNDLEDKNILLQREIIQRRRAEEENENLVKQLIQSQKMEALGRFASGIAHDLNNFLYPVLLNTQMLLEQCSTNTSFHETLEASLNSLYLQKDLIRQILLFSRKSEQKFSPVHVKPLLKETIALLKSLIPRTIKVKQCIDCPADLILGDPTQIQQIIMNLCSNAVDAMNAQAGMIEIKLGNIHLDQDQTYPDMKAGEYLSLSVKDSGCGMTEEVLRHIFEPFFTTKEIGKGTGMGLSVIHGIVKSHGGVITVDSDYGRGSQFTVYLPLKVDENH